MKKSIIIVLVLAILGVVSWKLYPHVKNLNSGNTESLILDPLNATYTIDDKPVKLINGRSEEEAAPGSASKVITSIFGKPVLGDVNADGIHDAVMFMTQTSGGSGLFYYAAMLTSQNDGFFGQSAVFLGDRIAPQSILVKDGVAMVNFADRLPNEPETATPSVGTTTYITLEDGVVKQFHLSTKGEQFFSGNLIMSEGARVFTPCGGTAHWVIGTSAAYADLTKAYTMYKSTTTAYSSVYAVVSGIVVSAPTDGFGQDYTYGIDIKNLLKVLPYMTCEAN